MPYNLTVNPGAIRPFEPKDKPALFHIAAETAFFGAPIETFLDDRRLFNDIFYRYYTDFEPEHAWVAEIKGQVVGFLTGCIDTRRQDKTVARRLLPDLLINIVRRQYRIGRKTMQYALRLGLGTLRGEIPPADGKQYPAHLHINLDPAFRGRSLGRRLMEAYLDQLSALDIPGVHLHTTNINRAACALYEKMGFDLIAERPTSVWKEWVHEPVFSRVYARRITAGVSSPVGEGLKSELKI